MVNPIRAGSGFVVFREMIAMKSIVLSIILAGLTFLAASYPASAAVEYNQWIPFEDDFDSCTGEVVAVTGTQHIIGRTTEDATGKMHFSFTRHTQGTGVGTESGAEYLLIDSVHRSVIEGTEVEGATVYTEGFSALLIRKGESAPSDDSLVTLLTHYTITPDGMMTVSIEFGNATCR